MRVAGLLLVLLLVAGCSGYTGIGQAPNTDEEHQTGVRELTYYFHPDTPPREMLQETQSEIVVVLENKGASDISDGVVSLIAEQSYLSIVGASNRRFSLEGRNKYNPEGESDRFSFLVRSSTLDRQSQRHELQVLATVCYDYSTEIDEVVCIDPDPYGQPIDGIKKICKMSDISSSGQGAPIVITKIDMSVINERDGRIVPIFDIHIENKGNGEVVAAEDASQLCSGVPLRPETFNKVSIYGVLADEPLECNTRTVNLVGKKATVRCTLPYGIDPYAGAYTTPLHIQLSYGYSDAISKSFSLVR
jgi:hypothetical protein